MEVAILCSDEHRVGGSVDSSENIWRAAEIVSDIHCRFNVESECSMIAGYLRQRSMGKVLVTGCAVQRLSTLSKTRRIEQCASRTNS